MTAIQRAVVDDLGNINVHGRSGLVVTFKIETATAGVYEDISALSLFFEVAGKFRLALTAGADIYTRQIVVTQAQVATIGVNSVKAFAVTDETPTNPRNLWSGLITAFGFSAAPAGADATTGVATSYAGAAVIVQPDADTPTVVVRYEGPIGETGPAGADGADGADGATGATGQPGTDGIGAGTIDTIGHPSPTATGSAVGATTYIFGEPAPEDQVITLMHTGGLGSGGSVKIKSADDSTGSWVLEALQTVSVSAGVVDTVVSLSLPKGRRIAFYASGVVGSVANGGPITPYYTLAGDVLSGAIGSQTTNASLQIGFKVQSVKDFADAKTAAIETATGDARINYSGLADTDLGSSLSSSTVYYDPRPLSPGVPTTLYLYGRTAGWVTVYLAARSGDTQHDVYRTFPVYLDVGKNTITAGSNTLGKGIPRDISIKAYTIAGVQCPSGGGQVAYTSTDGPGASNENVIGYRLPQGNFTGTGAMGVQTLSWSATSNRQIAMEWQITEEDSPRKRAPQRKEFLNELFAGTSLPTRLMAVGTVPTFTAGKATSAATGFGNVLRARFGHALHKQVRFVANNFGSGTSVIASGTRSISGNYGSAASADCAANTWSVYQQHGAVSSTPTIQTTRTWPGTFSSTSSRLVWKWERDGRKVTVTLTDVGVQPIVSDSYEVDAMPADIPPVVSNPSDSLTKMGMLNGALESFALSGSVETTRMQEFTPQRRATGLIIGDSISNASRCNYADGWAQQLEAVRAASGLETAIMAVDGWAMDNGAEALRHILHLLPDLEWVIFALGTNRSAAVASDPRDKNMFEAAATASLAMLTGRGITPYFMVPAPHPFSPTVATAAERLAFLQTTTFKLIRGDLALTQSDGVTFDPALYYNSGTSDVHPIKAGHDKMLARVYVDAPELLIASRQAVRTPVEIPMFCGGKPSASEILARVAFTFPYNIFKDRCVASAETAATASTVFTLSVGGTTVGTVTFAIGATTGTFSITAPNFAAGVLKLVAPASPDATLANISITLSGER